MECVGITYRVKGGSKIIINNSTVSFKNGHITTIVGPNGVGKSTLLKLLSGFLIPNEGSIRLNNQDLNHYTPLELAQLRVVLPQNHTVYFNDTVLDYIKSYEIGGATTYNSRYLNRIIKDLDVEQLLLKNIHQLSGGEFQLIQITKVLAKILSSKQKQKFVLLDEPFNHLDIFYKNKLISVLNKLVEEYKLTIIIVVHELYLLPSFAHEIVSINKKGNIKITTFHDFWSLDNIADLYGGNPDDYKNYFDTSFFKK